MHPQHSALSGNPCHPINSNIWTDFRHFRWGMDDATAVGDGTSAAFGLGQPENMNFHIRPWFLIDSWNPTACGWLYTIFQYFYLQKFDVFLYCNLSSKKHRSVAIEAMMHALGTSVGHRPLWGFKTLIAGTQTSDYKESSHISVTQILICPDPKAT